MMQGHLLREGYRIPHARIRDCLHRIDLDGVAIRWAATVQRRKYTVSSPLSLWHIDGNHKLIRLAYKYKNSRGSFVIVVWCIRKL